MLAAAVFHASWAGWVVLGALAGGGLLLRRDGVRAATLQVRGGKGEGKGVGVVVPQDAASLLSLEWRAGEATQRRGRRERKDEEKGYIYIYIYI